MQVAMQLLKEEIWIYSPIVHCHEMAERHKLPKDFAFWEKYNRAMLETADGLYILQLDGWELSKGLQSEIKFATKLNIPLTFLPYPLPR